MLHRTRWKKWGEQGGGSKFLTRGQNPSWKTSNAVARINLSRARYICEAGNSRSRNFDTRHANYKQFKPRARIRSRYGRPVLGAIFLFIVNKQSCPSPFVSRDCKTLKSRNPVRVKFAEWRGNKKKRWKSILRCVRILCERITLCLYIYI